MNLKNNLFSLVEIREAMYILCYSDTIIDGERATNKCKDRQGSVMNIISSPEGLFSDYKNYRFTFPYHNLIKSDFFGRQKSRFDNSLNNFLVETYGFRDNSIIIEYDPHQFVEHLDKITKIINSTTTTIIPIVFIYGAEVTKLAEESGKKVKDFFIQEFFRRNEIQKEDPSSVQNEFHVLKYHQFFSEAKINF
jgi:hypothetical protein